MRRETRATKEVVTDLPIKSFIFGKDVATVNTHEAQNLVNNQGAWVIRSFIKHGRKFQEYMLGTKHFGWAAGLHDGTPEDDFPTPPVAEVEDLSEGERSGAD